jgi:putative ABC transport system ATP-binding protein
MSQLIELEAVHKSYHLNGTGVPALRGVSLTVNAGEFAALLGPSGSGKSTLLNLCGLIDTPDEGRCRFAGEDAAGLTERERALLRRAAIGFVFQGFNLMPVLTVFENVEYPLLLMGLAPRERRGRVEEMLERTGLAAFARQLPDHLSGGQRQRVAIARALVKQPRLVIADEPTANLDTATATQVIDLMHALARAQNTTFLIATHDKRMAARCDREVHLIDGVLQ